MPSPQLIPHAQVAPKGGSILGEWLVFGILAALFFGVVLGIPYLYRLATTPWASAGLHPQTGITGSWVGALSAPEVKTDFVKDPFESEGSYQIELRSALQQKRSQILRARAVYLDLGLDAFKVGLPGLKGKVRMCAYNAAKADFEFTTLSVGDNGADLMLTTKASDEFGRLRLNLNDGKLQTSYDILGDKIDGTLIRGQQEDFEHVCKQVAATAREQLSTIKE